MDHPPAATAPMAPEDGDFVVGEQATEESLAAAGFEVRVGVPVLPEAGFKTPGCVDGHAMSAAVTPARAGNDGMAASPIVADALPAGNCRQFKRINVVARFISALRGNKNAMCECGFPMDDPCHQIPHVCQICGETFTAAANIETSCMVHPMPRIQKVGGGAHATTSHRVYIWQCCPDKPQKCSSEAAFKAKNLPHGAHM